MDLFTNDPVFAPSEKPKRKALRNRLGQFATAEQIDVERTKHENLVLKRKATQYYRAFLALAKDNSRLTRELNEMKNKLKGLINGTAKH